MLKPTQNSLHKSQQIMQLSKKGEIELWIEKGQSKASSLLTRQAQNGQDSKWTAI